MPTDNRLGPHENQRTFPSIPEPPQHHPEQFVRDSKPRLWVPPFQNSELLPESQIFQEQLAANLKVPLRSKPMRRINSISAYKAVG
jgi:hypothetical protein